MSKCKTCDNLIAYPTQSCKLRLLNKPCEWVERFDALPILREKEKKNAKRKRKRKA